jgi:phosphate transport system substrate-binding protein
LGEAGHLVAGPKKMGITMTRTCLRGAVSALALASISTSAYAASTINGGGSTSSEEVYLLEQPLFNSGTNTATFGTYWESGGTAGQTGLLTDDLSCLINKVDGNNGGKCDGGSEQGQPGNTVDYATSDGTFSSTQITGWATFTYGQPAAGNLIQLPSMGTSQSIPVQNSAVTGNGTLVLNDDDLCGVFSGKLTDFSQLALGKGSVTPTAGAITVVVRSDGAGATSMITGHLSAVCTTGNGGNSNITFTSTTTFASLFPNGVLPTNFLAEAQASGVATELESLTSAVGYVSPDWTTEYPHSGALVNGEPSTLVIASVLNGKTAELPTLKNITAALAHPVVGTNLTPPENASEGANPTDWVPLIETASVGYPIVGYTTIDFAQCYADKTIAAGIKSYLNDHYYNASYKSIQANNGFVTVSSSGAAKFLEDIKKGILKNSLKWNTDIQDKKACKGLAGR